MAGLQGREADGVAKELAMSVLKRLLNRCLWIVFAGALKVALVLYIFSLPGTAPADAAPEEAVKGGEIPPDQTAEENVSSPLLRLAAIPGIARLRTKAGPMQSV